MSENLSVQPTSNSHQCEQTTKSGARCLANTVNGSNFCFTHDPAFAEERTAARRRGGEHKHIAVLPADTPEISLKSGSEIAAIAERMINLTLRGEIDAKVSNAALGWANISLKVRGTIVLEERIAELEAALKMVQPPLPTLAEGRQPAGHAEKNP